MLDINRIKQDKQGVEEALAKKGCVVDLAPVIAWDNERKAAISSVEGLKARRNKVSAEIPKLKKEGKPVEHIFKEMREIGDEIADRDADINALVERIADFLSRLPNLPDSDLLPGEKENNEVIRVVGEKPEFSFPLKNHVDLCTSLGLIDYERGVKLSGNGFWIYRGDGARLEWALLNYFVEEHLKDGYEFILPPHQLGYACGYGAGQFPKFSDEVYWLDVDEDRHRNRFMLPTAETALVNMYAGEIIEESKLPMKFFAYTPCYRKEAGSARAEERGMIRGHQFNKVEMVQYAHPDHSMEAFNELVDKAARLVEGLGLHFRVSKLAAGDCSASMARTYDVELWIPSMGIYKECSSVSNANDYQARRNKQTRLCAHFERERARDQQAHPRHRGAVPERGRHRHRARSPAQMDGRAGISRQVNTPARAGKGGNMREELKKYADEAYEIVETAANEIGSRLPGSEGERKFAHHMAGKLRDIGIEPVEEKFLVSPRASIGGIPYAGWAGIVAAVLMLFPSSIGIGFHGLAFFICLGTLIWLVCSVFLYKTWFDFAFKQEPSQNVYGELLPADGKYDYTIMVSGHTDTA